MTNATKSVPLSRSLDVPFNKLFLSQSNVRQVNAGISIEELSEDIARRGLLQSLNVRSILDATGAPTDKYEVPAGGRRYRALEWLVKAKRMAKNAPIPCVIKDDAVETSLEDDSLAENTHRVALHPLDQYRAFLALRRQNMTEEDIAARYFVSVAVVRQRLRLAAVSPVLLDLYATEALTLDQLMAFSITGDHVRQEQVWEAVSVLPNSWQKGAQAIRNHLTDSAVSTNDRRAVFVGMEAYEAAGGEVLRDLFSGESGGCIQDALLLDRLVDEKLQSIANDLTSEGWKWIEVLPSLPFDHLHGLRKLAAHRAELSTDSEAALAGLKSEQAELETNYADWEELPDEVDARLGEIEGAIEALDGAGEETFDPTDIRLAGVVVSLDRNGSPQILRGYVRPQDEPVVEKTEAEILDVHTTETETEPTQPQTAVIALGGAEPPAATGVEEDDVLRPIPEKLLIELTAYKTVALREAVAGNPFVAMTLLLHKLVGDTFQHRYGGSCLGASVFAPQLFNIAPKGLDESLPAKAMDDRHAQWADIIPRDDQALWDWLTEASEHVRAELLAFCTAYGMNALFERANPYGAGPTQHAIALRLKHATRVALATGLNLVEAGWRPTADSYLSRVPRPRILEAVREGCGERTAHMIDHLKKGDMVVEAERLLVDTGWLPEPLRMPSDEAPNAANEQSLPAFLTDNDADAGTAASAIAAQYRASAFDYPWHDSVYKDFQSLCELIGVTFKTSTVRLMGGGTRQKPNIYFRGFYSQGDGAYFEGSYRYRKGACAAVRAYAPRDEFIHRIADELAELQRRHFYRLRARCYHRGHYYHEYSMIVDVERIGGDVGADVGDELRESLRDLARWLYGRLTQDYEYLSNDEAIDEAIEGNAYRFTENGHLFA